MFVEHRVNDIQKSPSDSASYRGLVLKNGLTVLLISDPNTEKSFVSLSVAVGNLSEPKILPGLAHLCEHMLFVSSKKYPKENSFLPFLKENEGEYQGNTQSDHTIFASSIKNDMLNYLLDRVANFFIEPLFPEEFIQSEIRKIQLEYECEVVDDARRIDYFKINSTENNHPFCGFKSGSKETLEIIPIIKNINVHNELLKFYSKWYSSNIMKLIILGAESLDKLERLVVPFINIKNNDVDIPIWTDPIFKIDQLSTKTIIVPIQNDTKLLYLNFTVPNQNKHLKSMPIRYLETVINRYDSSSLFAILKKKDWCNNILAYYSTAARGVYFFDIKIALTRNGIANVDNIITLFFQFVIMIKYKRPLKWFHEETKNICAGNFFSQIQEKEMNFINELSIRMINFELKDVLIAGHLIEEWEPNLIQELLSYLRPDNMRVTVVSGMFKNKTKNIEKHFGINYSVNKIPKQMINKWKKLNLCEDFKMPPKNEFVVSEFTLVPIDKNEPRHPFIIFESPLLRCWFKTDTEFRVPKAFISIHYFNSMLNTDPLSINVMSLFVDSFREFITKTYYNATFANLQITIIQHEFGFKLQFFGYKQKLHIFVKMIIEKLMNFKINPHYFNTYKQKRINELIQMSMESLDSCTLRLKSKILSDIFWTPKELLKTMNDVEINKSERIIEYFMSHLFLEVLVYGNVDKTLAMDVVQTLQNSFPGDFCKLLPSEIVRPKEIKLHEGEDSMYQISTNNIDNSSCVIISFQCGVLSMLKYMELVLFYEIIKDSIYEILYTQEKLGYEVSSLISENNGVMYLNFIIQTYHIPVYINSRIEKFIDAIECLLKNMGTTRFNNYKTELYNKLMKQKNDMLNLANLYDNEILNHSYNFNRLQTEIEALKYITFNDILKLYYKKFEFYSPKRQKIIVCMKSTIMDVEDGIDIELDNDEYADSNIEMITDISQFKRTHQLYPSISPFLPIEHFRNTSM